MRFATSLFLSVSVIGLSVAACAGHAEVGNAPACNVDGHTYVSGEVWSVPNTACPAASGSCTCKPDGKVECSAPTIACTIDAGPQAQCISDGKTYSAGESWVKSACPGNAEIHETCSCGANGVVSCVTPDIACPLVRCDDKHVAGDTWQEPTCPGRTDFFDTCSCKPDGTTECSGPAIACVDVDAGVR